MKLRKDRYALARCALLILGMSVTAMACTPGIVRNPQVAPDARLGVITFTACRADLRNETVEAECGVLYVPENRNAADTRKIALPVVRIPSQANAPAEPIFFLQGGPGISNLTFAIPLAVRQARDVVIVGYRGVDGSVVLDCPELSEVLGEQERPLGSVALAQSRNALAACATRLSAEGADLNGYTMAAVSHDLEAARTALGYDKINILSQSYGTRVALIHAYQYPHTVSRMVLIGANPPGAFLWKPDAVSAIVERLSQLCAQDTQCAARTPNLEATVRTVLENPPQSWLWFDIDPDRLRMVTFMMLFHRGTTTLVLDAYMAAAEGDPSGLALLSTAYGYAVPNSLTWGDFFAKGAADFDPNSGPEIDLSIPVGELGSPMSLFVSGVVSGWPTTPLSPELNELRRIDTPTLILSGNIDMSTPAETAKQELLPRLPQGKQVILKDFGHVADLWMVQQEASEHLIATYFASGEVDSSRFEYAPLDFDPPVGFPGMAKLAVWGGGALIVLLVAVAL